MTIIGIHTPETEAEHDRDKLLAQVEKHKIKYPILVDNDMKNWNAWGNRWWPSTYLIDKNGWARYRWDGELKWKGTDGEKIMREKLDELLAEKAEKKPEKNAKEPPSRKR